MIRALLAPRSSGQLEKPETPLAHRPTQEDKMDQEHRTDTATLEAGRLGGDGALRILGVSISALTRDQALALLLDRLSRRRITRVAFANSNLLMQARAATEGAAWLEDFLVLNDGVALDAAARLLHGRAFPDNLAGTDFVPLVLSRLPPGTRVFLLGSRPGVAEKAGTVLAGRTGVTVCGTRDGFGLNEATASEIAAARPDVLLVALGNPLQELWLRDHAERTGAILSFGVGALFDFLAEEVPRAPVWVRNLHGEWLFRLVQEPRRLARRYTVEMTAFFLAVWRERKDRTAAPPGSG
ncbi:MAG: putative glycosyltransferase [Hyphomicrobiales bacterium]|nr:putative glycosyltransferase [Hyphomicrobiales bacterium]